MFDMDKMWFRKIYAFSKSNIIVLINLLTKVAKPWEEFFSLGNEIFVKDQQQRLDHYWIMFDGLWDFTRYLVVSLFQCLRKIAWCDLN